MITVASIRVLIAEPNDVLRAMYGEFLGWRGFHVATASNGLECIDQLRHFHPQVLVLDPDIPMGGGDGVLSLMHEDSEITLVPVLVVTAANDQGVLDRVLDFPIDAVWSKPLDPFELAQGIHQVLEQHRTPGPHGPRSGRSPWA